MLFEGCFTSRFPFLGKAFSEFLFKLPWARSFFGGGPDLFLVGFDNLLLRFFFFNHLVNSAGFFVFFGGGLKKSQGEGL